MKIYERKNAGNSKIKQFSEILAYFNTKDPDDLQRQIMWNGIRFIMYKLATTEEENEIIKKQDEIFRTVQALK